MTNLNFLNKPFPELRERVDFGEFHEALAGNYVEIWLNASVEHREAWTDFKKNLEGSKDKKLSPSLIEKRNALWACMWNCTPDQAGGLLGLEQSGQFIEWLTTETWAMISTYAERRAKAGSD